MKTEETKKLGSLRANIVVDRPDGRQDVYSWRTRAGACRKTIDAGRTTRQVAPIEVLGRRRWPTLADFLAWGREHRHEVIDYRKAKGPRVRACECGKKYYGSADEGCPSCRETNRWVQNTAIPCQRSPEDDLTGLYDQVTENEKSFWRRRGYKKGYPG